MVLFAMPRSSSYWSNSRHDCRCARSCRRRVFCACRETGLVTTLRTHAFEGACRVPLNQQKNGTLALVLRSMKSMAAADVSSSMVSIRFLVSGRVYLNRSLPNLAEARIFRPGRPYPWPCTSRRPGTAHSLPGRVHPKTVDGNTMGRRFFGVMFVRTHLERAARNEDHARTACVQLWNRVIRTRCSECPEA